MIRLRSVCLCVATWVASTGIAAAQSSKIDGGLPRVSRDGSRVALISNRGGTLGLYVQDVASGTLQEIRAPGAGPLAHGDWAPDNQRLLVIRRRGESAGLYAYDVVTTKARTIISDSGIVSASWSPGGEWIVYAAGSPPNIGLFVVDSSGGRRRTLSGAEGIHANPTWFPDGSRVAYQKAGIWSVAFDGTDPRRIVEKGSSASISPDGQWLAYVTSIQAPVRPGEQFARARRADVHVTRIDGSQQRTLTAQLEDRVVETPAWMPDGKSLIVQVVDSMATYLAYLSATDGAIKPLRKQ